MKESEKKLERQLRTQISERGGWCLKMLCTFVNGLPDRLCLLPGGVVFFVETKSTGDDPSKIQLYVHRKLKKLGFEVFVLDSTETMNYILAKYAK